MSDPFPSNPAEMLFHLIWKLKRNGLDGWLSPKEQEFFREYKGSLPQEVKNDYDYHDAVNEILSKAHKRILD